MHSWTRPNLNYDRLSQAAPGPDVVTPISLEQSCEGGASILHAHAAFKMGLHVGVTETFAMIGALVTKVVSCPPKVMAIVRMR
jgi:hypothetical protein